MCSVCYVIELDVGLGNLARLRAVGYLAENLLRRFVEEHDVKFQCGYLFLRSNCTFIVIVIPADKFDT